MIKEISQLSRLSQGKLLKQRYKKFRKMGELSHYSLEAMNQEVERLMHISSDPRRRRRGGRAARRTALGGGAAEAQILASD